MSDNQQNEITESWSPKPNVEETAVLHELNARREFYADAYHTSIDELRQFTPQGLRDRLGKEDRLDALAEFGSLDIQYENLSGDKYLVNKYDEITEFTYTDKAGKPTQSFQDIQYFNGRVDKFTLNGDTWTSGESAWTNQNGESLNLGTVAFDKSGMNASGSDAAQLGAPQRSYLTDAGDEYQLNANGKVSQFLYRSKDGFVVQGFTNIQYDKDGKVESFANLEGEEFRRTVAGPTSPFSEARTGGRWTNGNAIGWGSERPIIELGEVTVDAQGLHATGPGAIASIYQPLVMATGRKPILSEAHNAFNRYFDIDSGENERRILEQMGHRIWSAENRKPGPKVMSDKLAF